MAGLRIQRIRNRRIENPIPSRQFVHLVLHPLASIPLTTEKSFVALHTGCPVLTLRVEENGLATAARSDRRQRDDVSRAKMRPNTRSDRQTCRLVVGRRQRCRRVQVPEQPETSHRRSTRDGLARRRQGGSIWEKSELTPRYCREPLRRDNRDACHGCDSACRGGALHPLLPVCMPVDATRFVLGK